MELEKELVAALRALELHEVPEDMVASLFNSGGTHVVTTSGTGETVTAGDALFPDLVGNVTVSQLRSVDRVFAKYLRKHLAAIDASECTTSSPATPRNKRLSLDASTTTDLEVAELWDFLASDEAVTSIVGASQEKEEAEETTHAAAAHRTFFTLLHAVINIRDTYATLSADEQRRALAKALLASKIYLTWLQIPGGSAYGLFMPYVYRHVLDVLKKWIALARADALARAKDSSSSSALAAARRSARQRTIKEKQLAAARRDNDDFTEIQHTLVKFGLDLVRMLATFLTHFSLAASTESVVPTIEAVIALQTMALDDATGDATTRATLEVVAQLLNGVHGDAAHVAKVVAHCYVPGLALHEPLAIEHRCALRFHRLAIDVISRLEYSLRSSADEADSDSVEREISLLRLGVLQHVCLRAPERSEERQRVLAFAFALAVGRPSQTDIVADTTACGGLRDEERVRLARFLTSFSRNASAKCRQFAVELLGRCVLERAFWQTAESDVASALPDALVVFAGGAPLLDVLIDRSRDKVSTVRAKAIAAISSALTLSLATMAARQRDDTDDNDDDGAAGCSDADADNTADGASSSNSRLIARSLQKLLYVCTRDARGGRGSSTFEATPLMQRLVELFRESLADDKTFVRKAAVQALEALLVARAGPIRNAMRRDVAAIHARCSDASVVVRVQAIKSLSAILRTFPTDAEVQALWNLGVLPLCADPEATVQAAALDATNRLVFDRVVAWDDARARVSAGDGDAPPLPIASVWGLVAHLDGVMVKCVQKALRVLLKDDRVELPRIVRACVHAIHECITAVSTAADGEADDSDSSAAALTQYWDFSWVVLEELALTGHLVAAASTRAAQQHLDVVVRCWDALQQQALPVAFTNGAKRILRVIAALAPVLATRDANAIADGILASLRAFTIPLNVIADAVAALHSLCKAKAQASADADAVRGCSFGWGAALLALCETSLRQCLERDPQRVDTHTLLLQKQLICVGEVALLEFTKDDDKSRDALLLPVSAGVQALVQLFMLPQIAAHQLVDNDDVDNDDVDDADDASTASRRTSLTTVPTDIPTPVRVCAFVTLGKLCLRDQELAKSCITMLIRELRTCSVAAIRSNILLLLGDLCIRYTALVDAYLPAMALSLLDASALIRRSALLLFAQLILQDYIKWRESLLRFFLRAVVDTDDELAALARHVLCGPLRLKSPHLFSTKFIEMVFVFNRFDAAPVPHIAPLDRESVEALALPGNANFPKRFQLYRFLLQHMTDEQKLQISMKLCTDVLEEVTDGTLPLAATPAEITDTGTEAVLKDTFAILCSSDIKLSTARENDDDLDETDTMDESAATGSVSTQLAAAKTKLLSKMSKKNYLDNVVPVLIGLKHKLESKRSPVMRYLQHYFYELFKLYRSEVQDILSADPQMAMEVEYDMRQFELHHKKQLAQQQQQLRRASVPAASQGEPTATAASSSSEPSTSASTETGTGAAARAAPPATPPATPSPTRLATTTPFQMLDVSETPVANAPDSAVRLRDEVHAAGANAKQIAARRRRRRRSLPPVESPLRVLEQRTTSARSHDADGNSDAEDAAGHAASSRVMLFSPSKDLLAVSGSGGTRVLDATGSSSWHVAATSPTVAGKSSKAKGDKSRSKSAKATFTQQDLEQRMQQDLDASDVAASEASASSSSESESETAGASRRNVVKSRSKATAKPSGKSKQQVKQTQAAVPCDRESDDEFVQLPLKKKAKKKKTVVTAASATKSKSKSKRTLTMDAKRSKRKRD